MGTSILDIDINAKLPIIKAESEENPFYRSTDSNNYHSQQNGLSPHQQIDADNHSNHSKLNHHNNIHKSSHNDHSLDLPQPSFRPASNYNYCKRTNTYAKHRKTISYYHYDDPTPEVLLERVEYDMDEEDYHWLKRFNKEHASKHYDYQITEDDFEKIMDRLEKESYFELQRSGKEVIQEVDEDAVCAICNDGECNNANVILFCDMCDLAVHQECYGVPYVPEGQWLCRRCLQSPSNNVECILCPNLGGAFKQTDKQNEWAHVICALWIPEVCFANTVFLEPIDSISSIPQARWKLTCYICRQKGTGACIQCHKPNCYVPFHVTCAQRAGLYMRISTEVFPSENGPYTDVKKVAFCDAHAPKDSSRRQGMYSGGESDEEDVDSQAYKKWKKDSLNNLKKTRKILEDKRNGAWNPVSLPKVDDEKLCEISKLLTLPRRKKVTDKIIKAREDMIKRILGYWMIKRKSRNGVPLLRRLQVSYSGSVTKPSIDRLTDTDKDKYTKLRYDLEKARLLVGEVKKRELMKKKLFKLSRDIVDTKFRIFDIEYPPIDE